MYDWLIVDGYNIIFSWAEFDQLREEDMGLARQRLIDMLHDFSSMTGKKTTLVFDAYLIKGNVMSKEVVGFLEIIFTKEGETADMLIERLTGEAEPDKIVFVATADWIEQRVVFGKGAFRMTPNELHKEIVDTKSKENNKLLKRVTSSENLENRLDNNIKEILNNWRKNGK